VIRPRLIFSFTIRLFRGVEVRSDADVEVAIGKGNIAGRDATKIVFDGLGEIRNGTCEAAAAGTGVLRIGVRAGR